MDDKIFYVSGQYSSLLKPTDSEQSSHSLPKLSLHNTSSVLESMSNVLSGDASNRSGEKVITNEFINGELERLVILKQSNVLYPGATESKEKLDDERLDFQEHIYEVLDQRVNLNEYTQGDFQSSMFVVKLLEHLNLLLFEQAVNQSEVSTQSSMQLPVDDVITTDVTPKFPLTDNKAFVYINDDKEICGFCVTYTRINHAHWMMAITKNSVSDSNEKQFHYFISPALQNHKIFELEKERFDTYSALEKKYLSEKAMLDEVKKIVKSEECYKIYNALLNETFHLKINSVNEIINQHRGNFIYGKNVFTRQFVKSDESRESLFNNSEISNLSMKRKAVKLKGGLFILADVYFVIFFADEIVRQFFYHKLSDCYYYQAIVFCYPILMTFFMIIAFCVIYKRFSNNSAELSKLFYVALFCVGMGELMIMFSFTRYNHVNKYGTPAMFFAGALLLAGLRKYSTVDNNPKCVFLKILLTFIQSLGAIALVMETLDIQHLEKTSSCMKVMFSSMLFLTVLMTIIDVYKICKLSSIKSFNIDSETVASFPSTTSSNEDVAPIPKWKIKYCK